MRSPEFLTRESLESVEAFCAQNEVRVGFDMQALHQEYYSGHARVVHRSLTQYADYRHLYAPWYRSGNQDNVPYDHWLGSQWSYAELGNRRAPLPELHREQIEAMTGNIPSEGLEVLTFAIGRRRLVLDGNHRLAALLRQEQDDPLKFIDELRIVAEPHSRIIPDAWSWYTPSKRAEQAGKVLSLGIVAISASACVEFARGSREDLITVGISSLSLALSGLLSQWPELTARIAQRSRRRK